MWKKILAKFLAGAVSLTLIPVIYLLAVAEPTNQASSHQRLNPPPDRHIDQNFTASFQERTTQGLKISAKLGNTSIDAADGRAYLLINLEGENRGAQKHDVERPPLQLSLVIDRSGSMNGDKLRYVKAALKDLAETLDDRDRLSLVIYDDQIDTLYADRQFNRRDFLSVIDEITSRGTTYLEGGLRAGLQEIRQHGDPEYLQRVILLSDGLANVGRCAPKSLANLVQELSGPEVTVTTIGVGADFDENILTAIATAGNGNYYFLEQPADAARIFAREFSGLITTTARDIKITFNLDPRFTVIRGVGYDLKNSAYFNPHDLSANKKNSYLFELSRQEHENLVPGEIVLANMQISFSTPDSDYTERMELPITANLVNERVAVLADDDVYREYMDAYVAEELWQVDQDLNEQRNRAAKDRVNGLVKEMSDAVIRLPGIFESELQSLGNKLEYLDQLGSADVRGSAAGRVFKKQNQAEAYEKYFQK